ncbi:hypothetical protein J1C56_23005 [Aminobacter anthyllidis]|uniref:Uncharacterized protein n=1 Tax=Aminobacter anthyllidis TaxID=1035067 RepID=A0A9X1AF80_9HYPH|nr:hypothetical protein [Aminobacter anthyllidis]MBT1158471.1 hypothetical protein [Aminobacter anthyllidis]
MAWKSKSFVHRESTKAFAKKVDTAASKHKTAMSTVVEEARALALDREAALKKIADPQLRKSAAQ